MLASTSSIRSSSSSGGSPPPLESLLEDPSTKESSGLIQERHEDTPERYHYFTIITLIRIVHDFSFISSQMNSIDGSQTKLPEVQEEVQNVASNGPEPNHPDNEQGK